MPTVAQPLVRFRGEADMNWQRENAPSVANDPKLPSAGFGGQVV